MEAATSAAETPIPGRRAAGARRPSRAAGRDRCDIDRGLRARPATDFSICPSRSPRPTRISTAASRWPNSGRRAADRFQAARHAARGAPDHALRTLRSATADRPKARRPKRPNARRRTDYARSAQPAPARRLAPHPVRRAGRNPDAQRRHVVGQNDLAGEPRSRAACAARSSRSSSSSLAGGSFSKSCRVDDHVAGRTGHHALAGALERLARRPGDVEQPLSRLPPRLPCRASRPP